jgi:RimJ/RimL family protein N-acetyltransferase
MDLVVWAAFDLRIDRIPAETAVDNLPSHRVLQGSGFRARTAVKIRRMAAC